MSRIRSAANFALLLTVAALSGCAQAAAIGESDGYRQQGKAQSPMSVPKAYSNLSRLQLLCAVQSDRGIERQTEDELCEAVKTQAQVGAPIEVVTVAPGDPKVLASDALTLIVHAGVDGDTMAVSIRPFRASGGEADVLFGARPFLIPIKSQDRWGPRLRAALEELLPWQSGDGQPRRMD